MEVRRFHSHSQCFDGGIWRQTPLMARPKGSHPWVTTHFCGVISTVTTRRLRKTYSPDLVGGGQSLQLHNLIDHLRFYVCSSARRFVHSLLNLSSNRMGLRCEVQCTPLPLELWECVEPLICRECGDTLVPSYKFREGRDTL